MRQINYILVNDINSDGETNDTPGILVSNLKYHFVVNSQGMVHNPIDISRNGDFLKKYDKCAIGIQYNSSLDSPSKARTSLINLLVRLRFCFPNAKILGISEVIGKTIRASAEMNRLRRELSDMP